MRKRKWRSLCNMKEQYQVFEFGNRMIVINREDRSCVGIRKEAFCEKDLDDPNSKLRKSLQKKEWLAKDNELDRMNTVYLLIINKCNLSCEFCSVRADKHNAEHLDSITLDVFDNRIMPLLNEIQPRRVILTGGEPLMNKEVVQIAQEIRKNLPDVYIMMQSNGFLIQDDEMLEKLSESIDSIEISSSHYNELIQLEERIKRIKKQGIKVTLSFLSDGNIDKLRRIIDFVVDEQVGLLLNFISPLGSAIDNDIKILSYEERVQVFKKMAEYILQKKYFDNNFTELFRQRIIARNACNALGKMLAIYPNGKCYICHSLENDQFCIGNCYIDSPGELLSNLNEKIHENQVKKLMDVDYKDMCKSCKLKYLCGGICGAFKYNHTDTIDICKLQKFFLVFNLLLDRPEKGEEYNLKIFIKLCEKKDEIELL